MIQVENLSKIFTIHQKEPGIKGSLRSLFVRNWVKKHALRDISFSIASGDIVGLVGANGAGKTTLAKILAGIIYPTSGIVLVKGFRPWLRENQYRQQMSLIMGQKAALWWDLPAYDCYLLLKEIYQIPTPVFRQRLDELASKLEVTGQLTTQIRRLSLGERMKVELIAALLHHPQVIFLDEPTIGLDLTAQRAVREFLLHYHQQYHPTMIVTSHYMQDIETLCQKIFILKEGSLAYEGTLAQIQRICQQEKIITLHYRSPENVHSKVDFHLPPEAGTIIKQTPVELQLRCKQEFIASTLPLLLNNFPVHDLLIQEMDISTIIESMQRGGSSP